ncbi:MAG: hypothetical protein KAI43_07015 [Candidatus Aureabacteria bacterium]|nr:hypothetical protein [Candidatus Auribacterota bacterium]
MKIIFNILIESSEYFAIIAGILGLMLFFTMSFSLDILKILGKLFNRPYSTKNIEQSVNKTTNIENALYARSMLVGAIVSFASVWIFFFLVFQLDLEKIIKILSIKHEMIPFMLALFQTAKLFSIFSIVICFIFGLILSFDRNSAEAISNKLNSWYDTERLEEKLDNTIFKDTDTICFLHNKFFGFLGLIASIILLVLAITNIVS